MYISVVPLSALRMLFDFEVWFSDFSYIEDFNFK